MVSWLRVFCLALLFVVRSLAFADAAPFDLDGPKLRVKVVHAGKSLPIAAVPNLAVGDQLSIKADLPSGQSAHYLLVATFLRGATNPPPESWFFASETWNSKGSGGLKISVPEHAQQVLVFLVPETGGDFKTLVNAVRGRPGAFVRASQNLNQAALDRSRLMAYLAAIRRISQSNPENLRTVSPLLARSLSIKFNSDCLQKNPELQASCLMQGQDSLILSDGHGTTMAAALTAGDPANLAQQLSNTPHANSGYYSPYISSAMDIVRIFDSFHTAQYQYIPALVTAQDDQLLLALNTPPSFHNPKSVLVTALPAVAEPPQMPLLRVVDSQEVYCAEKTDLILPVEGAPLVFSTGYAHDMVLRLKEKNGKFVDLPVKADAERGGFVVNTAGLNPANFSDRLEGSLHGYWGFESYNGPEFRLGNSYSQRWKLVNDDQQSLIVGHEATVHIEAENAVCIDNITLLKPTGETVKIDWKSTSQNQVEIVAPLKKVNPGTLKLLIKQYGNKKPDVIALQVFAPASRLDSFTLHAGDYSGVLLGDRLSEIKELVLNGINFKPALLTSTDGVDELSLIAADVQASEKLKEGETSAAKVALKDGRILDLETKVAQSRPRVTLIGKSVQLSASNDASRIQLTDPDEVPQNALLTFSVHAQVPEAFSGDEKIEVATVRGAFLTILTLANGITLADSQIALATLDTGKVFASSAAGPLRFRIIERGVAGDWQPLATLVRLPIFRNLTCPAASSKPCKLTGANLFLLNALSNDSQFTSSIQVSDGFTGNILSVPHPAAGVLYVKFHDDPTVINQVIFSAESSSLPFAPLPSKPATQMSTPSAAGLQSDPSSKNAGASSSQE